MARIIDNVAATASSNHPRRARPSPRSAAAIAAAVGTLLLILGGWAGPAGAHSGDQSYLYLDVTGSTISGRIEAPIRDLDAALGLDIVGSDAEVDAVLEEHLDEIHTYLGRHLAVGADGETWPITFLGANRFFSDLPEADDNYILFPFSANVAGGAVPRSFEVSFDPFFDEVEGRDALLLIGNDWQGGVIDNGHEVSATFDGGTRNQTIDLGVTSRISNLTASAKLGINHIRTGPDHILFVLVLLLPSVLVFTSRWEPTTTFGSALWRVLKIVTMFTVAHSITFTLAGLGILPLPGPRIVESVIAISIAAAALHNIRPLAPNREWLISFLFGLFHGMGFASLVEGLDVGRGTQLISLLGRNIGIEVGQSVVVLLLFPGLFLLRRTRYFQGFFVTMSVVLAGISSGWMIERVFEIDLAVSTWVEPAVAWPRVLWVVLTFTVVALGLNHIEFRGERLRPIGAGSSGSNLTGSDPTGSALSGEATAADSVGTR